MKKTVIALLFVLAFAFSITASAKTYKNLTYTRSVDKVTITGCDKDATSIVIPKEIEDFPVVYIAESAFKGLETLESVTFEEGSNLREIRNFAFADCTGLKSIVIPKSVKSINGAFRNCTNLETVIFEEGSNLETLQWAFINCASVKRIVLPKKVKEISWSFEDCASLEVVDFEEPSNCEKIQDFAFRNCTALREITIPSKTKSLSGAFYGCSNLGLIINNSKLDIRTAYDGGDYSFNYAYKVITPEGSLLGDCEEDENGFLFNESNSSEGRIYEIEAYVGEEETVTLPESFKGQPYRVYINYYRGLKNIIVPEGVKSLYLVVDSEYIDSVTVPASVTKVEHLNLGYPENATLYGYKGTEIERYAKENNIEFTVLEGEVEIPFPEIPFGDVSVYDWFYEDVRYAFGVGLINGKGGNDIFKPDDNMTYAEAIKLASCMHQLYTDGEVTLQNGTPWYQSYVDYAFENGIIKKDYPYSDIVTRAGYMEIFANSLPDTALPEINKVPLGNIPDVANDVPEYPSIYKLYRAGILAGVDDEHNCNPDGNIKRSEVAVIVNRMMNSSKRITFTINKEKISYMYFDMPKEKDWGKYTFGEKGDKTVVEQQREIYDAMTKAMNTEVKWKEIPEFNPTIEKYSHIKAITYDGLEYKGEKTKVFAYIGFPEGAEENSGVPAVVLIHGGGGHPFLEWVRLWNERGYAAIAMETTGYFPTVVNAGVTEGGNGGEFVYGLTEFFEEEGYISAPGRAYTSEYMEVSEQGPYHAISQVILAGNILRQHPRVDKDSIGITGISWGGVTLAQVIGYDNRFSFAIPIYGMAYLGDEMNPFGKFKDPYVDALWAAERNLNNAADIPILWFAYNDDNNFSINQYVNSFKHTVRSNSKTSLIMLSNWGHSHTWAWTKPESYYFADMITWGNKDFITFKSMPEGREINCKINIPDSVPGSVSAYFYYITEPMSYSKHNKYGWGSYMFLDQKWEKTKGDLTVDKETGTVTGTAPEDARGYYINISFKAYDGAKERIEVSSVYVPID